MPDKRVFLDTNGWIALLSSSDSLHRPARALWATLIQQGYSIYVTDWIAAETGNGLARPPARTHFPEAVELIRSSSRSHWITTMDDLFRRALQRYSERQDKNWGLVDCASFVVMDEHGIREAFTNDRHFQQAGFQPLLPLPLK
jgi:predicted nucleic acid-binding protein